MNQKPIVGYIRVSTGKQAKSGLGLEGQLEALRQYSERTGQPITQTYQEVETGKRADRPELARAIRHAKRTGGILVIAKLDRLARNVHFVSGLMESNVEFLCCDNPRATPLTIHILAAVAEDEARRISERTKSALAAYKARGGLLGANRPDCPGLTPEARRKGQRAAGEASKRLADEAYADLIDDMRMWHMEGLSYSTIAKRLNEQGERTRRGKSWSHVQVARVLKRNSG